ncbi:hypothetical protein L3556_13830 [Candidatus Synechococcus calcipolaris G9]|uniref:Uncharacterized protein n=1 Tax=Candidatus Synechococcus calcipolaris G9 TaxID=1497997 RepID=A0ABT6F2F8_9SYNE|nr:hypothetical protein [Candidatus Synechococcus calcipolaris]MDG2992002.1 hypothetical protein [Candidatus Synechococcus calcipolaris G9]
MSEIRRADQLLEKLTALEKRVGRILIRHKFGKKWEAMTEIEKAEVIAYCEQIIGEPQPLSHCTLRPNISLEISHLKVWSVSIECDCELTAHRISKWAATVSALVTLLEHSAGYRVRCLGLNPLAWRDALDRYAS